MATKEALYPSSVAMVARLTAAYNENGDEMLRDAAELLDAAIGDAVAWKR